MSPADAVAAGASYLVVGRPIIAAPDPRAGCRAIAADRCSGELVSRHRRRPASELAVREPPLRRVTSP